MPTDTSLHLPLALPLYLLVQFVLNYLCKMTTVYNTIFYYVSLCWEYINFASVESLSIIPVAGFRITSSSRISVVNWAICSIYHHGQTAPVWLKYDGTMGCRDRQWHSHRVSLSLSHPSHHTRETATHVLLHHTAFVFLVLLLGVADHTAP